MGSVNIEELFDNDRFPSGLSLIPLLLYTPLGVILALLRFFIGFHTFLVACLLPKSSKIRGIVIRTMCAVLGILVKKSGREHRDPKVRVMVANYTSTLDHLAVDLVMPNVLPSVWDLPPTLMWLLGYTDLGAKQGRETLIRNAKKFTSESKVPMLVFPEGASTNGKVGLLKFSVWPFSLDQPVQPLVLTLRRPPFAKVSSSVLGGRWWLDIFWFLFVPYTIFHIRILPAITLGGDEETGEFTKRCQQIIAAALGIEATSYTSADKVEYAKRILVVQPSPGQTAPTSPANPSTSTGLTGDSQIKQMAMQVKDVLPHVPVQVIIQDLAMTKDIDLTITNILEGKVTFESEENSPSVSPRPSPPPQSPAPQLEPKKSPTAAEKFAKNSNERHMSLEERKKALIESARHKYMIKHGMM